MLVVSDHDSESELLLKTLYDGCGAGKRGRERGGGREREGGGKEGGREGVRE